MRRVLGVLTGYLAWTALWLGGNAGLAGPFADEFETFQGGGALSAPAPLAAALGLSIVCSLLGGWLTRRITNCSRCVLALALALLITGIAVQLDAWDRMPLWYHIGFLAFLVPMTLAGGRVARR